MLYSLFEEQLRSEAEQNAPARRRRHRQLRRVALLLPGRRPSADDRDPRRYLSLLERAAAAVDIPVIASLNGVTPERLDRATPAAMQDAGAAAIELNIYYLPGDPTSPAATSSSATSTILQRVKDAVTRAGGGQAEPVLQLDRRDGPAARRGRRRRAWCCSTASCSPTSTRRRLAVACPASDLSSPAEARLPRTWIALLRGRVRASLAATTGVEDADDVAKYLLAGADVVMTASALLRHGPEYAAVLLDGLSQWMARKGFATVGELRGMLAIPDGADQTGVERAGYVSAMRAANMSQGPW